MNELSNGVARIVALMNGTQPKSDRAWNLAAFAIDAILEDGTEHHTGWDASLAIEYAAPQVEDIEDLTEDEEVEAIAAVREAINKFEQLAAAPQGIVLVNADNDYVCGIGRDLADAQHEVNLAAGFALSWEQVSESGFCGPATALVGRYQSYEIGLLDYEADAGDFVRAIGTPLGYWLARDVLDVDEAA
ncbi:hypothetical protein [Mesorhizobium sp. B2-4-17]|uniref:hypothetical protein n=1 Tax=Mesorhizobium sp. B2-4-17 TaxID=2589932 RepID=UPI00112AB57B|nr:hypothetical protein [Mesorhizobium sp. B2-4-17]TPK78219.1 hypothetical protein FJ548_25130 [Mesorhizobium sp. B2-4-17]